MGGPNYPNQSSEEDAIADHQFVCPARGCLFDVVADPTESNEVSAAHPEIVASMRKEMDRQAKTVWKAPRREDPACREAARSMYGGFYGPWKEVSLSKSGAGLQSNLVVV